MFKKNEKSVQDTTTEYMTIHMVDGRSFDVLYDKSEHGVHSHKDRFTVYAVMNNDLMSPDGHMVPSQFFTYGDVIELRGVAEYRIFINPIQIVSVQGTYLLSLP